MMTVRDVLQCYQQSMQVGDRMLIVGSRSGSFDLTDTIRGGVDGGRSRSCCVDVQPHMPMASLNHQDDLPTRLACGAGRGAGSRISVKTHQH